MMDEHGEYIVVLTDSIIETTLKGSFNGSGARAYRKSVEDKIKQLNGKPFLMLVNDLELEGGTPIAYELLEKYTHWLNQQPMIAKACLVSSMAQKEIMLQRVPAFKKQNILFFKDRDSALEWLHEQFQIYKNFENLN
ncbi:MAG: hypothetical protein OCD00_10865 [Colwellia sp.]